MPKQPTKKSIFEDMFAPEPLRTFDVADLPELPPLPSLLSVCREKRVMACNSILATEGKAYPRTCAECGNGPCRYVDPVEKSPTPEETKDPPLTTKMLQERIDSLAAHLDLVTVRISDTLKSIVNVLEQLEQRVTYLERQGRYK